MRSSYFYSQLAHKIYCSTLTKSSPIINHALGSNSSIQPQPFPNLTMFCYAACSHSRFISFGDRLYYSIDGIYMITEFKQPPECSI